MRARLVSAGGSQARRMAVRAVFAASAAWIGLGGLTGCEKAPEAELEAARTAVEAARKAGAERSAPALLLEASLSLDSAVREIDAQKKSFFGRDFADARRLLSKAGDQAREAGAASLRSAETRAGTAKDSLRPAPDPVPSGPAATHDAAESAINLAYAAYRNAGRRAGPEAKDALVGVMKALKEARVALKAKEYARAIGLAKAAEAGLDSLPE